MPIVPDLLLLEFGFRQGGTNGSHVLRKLWAYAKAVFRGQHQAAHDGQGWTGIVVRIQFYCLRKNTLKELIVPGEHLARTSGKWPCFYGDSFEVEWRRRRQILYLGPVPVFASERPSVVDRPNVESPAVSPQLQTPKTGPSEQVLPESSLNVPQEAVVNDQINISWAARPVSVEARVQERPQRPPEHSDPQAGVPEVAQHLNDRSLPRPVVLPKQTPDLRAQQSLEIRDGRLSDHRTTPRAAAWRTRLSFRTRSP